MYRDTIARGVALLDKNSGQSWVHLIDVQRLRIASCMFCVLGQLGRQARPNRHWSRFDTPYGFMIDRLGISSSSYYGFNSLNPFGYPFLTWAWRRTIRKLQAERAVTMATQREYELAR